MENIEQRVKKIVAEQLGVNEADIKIESAFVDVLVSTTSGESTFTIQADDSNDAITCGGDPM